MVRSVWKWIGLAGVVGVAAGGVLVVRDQRRRNAYTPDQVRQRLHRRLADAHPEYAGTGPVGAPTSGSGAGVRQRLSARLRVRGRR